MRYFFGEDVPSVKEFLQVLLMGAAGYAYIWIMLAVLGG